MSAPEKLPAPQPEPASTAHLKVRLAGVIILIVGLLSAALVYFLAADEAGADLSALQGKQYGYQLERIGGKSAVLAAQLNDWLGSLWHGRQLAWTLAVLSVMVALFCFWIASLMAVDVSDDKPADPPL